MVRFVKKFSVPDYNQSIVRTKKRPNAKLQLPRHDFKFSGPIQIFEKWLKAVFFQMKRRLTKINFIQIKYIILDRQIIQNLGK
jgi:hypothetical protein